MAVVTITSGRAANLRLRHNIMTKCVSHRVNIKVLQNTSFIIFSVGIYIWPNETINWIKIFSSLFFKTNIDGCLLDIFLNK
jgi:hypothetical protein